MGLRTVYAKTVRDSRRAALVVGVVAGGFMFGTGAPYGGRRSSRRSSCASSSSPGSSPCPPALRGLLGEPINIETMGGFLALAGRQHVAS